MSDHGDHASDHDRERPVFRGERSGCHYESSIFVHAVANGAVDANVVETGAAGHVTVVELHGERYIREERA